MAHFIEKNIQVVIEIGSSKSNLFSILIMPKMA